MNTKMDIDDEEVEYVKSTKGSPLPQESSSSSSSSSSIAKSTGKKVMIDYTPHHGAITKAGKIAT